MNGNSCNALMIYKTQSVYKIQNRAREAERGNTPMPTQHVPVLVGAYTAPETETAFNTIS